MPTTPLVAVAAARLAPGRISGWTDAGEAAGVMYLSALRRAGSLPLVVGGPAGAHAGELLARVDGVVLLGGPDVDPARYGASPHPSTYGVDPERDASEVDLARAAVSAGVPLLAVCRGLQVLNVALGGALHQHLPDGPSGVAHGVPVGEGDPAVHPVSVEGGSRLAEVERLGGRLERCVSIHHQAVDRVAPGLHPTAYAPDGVIEALEAPPGAPWCLGVQWHPERSAATDPSQQAVFDVFAAACR